MQFGIFGVELVPIQPDMRETISSEFLIARPWTLQSLGALHVITFMA